MLLFEEKSLYRRQTLLHEEYLLDIVDQLQKLGTDEVLELTLVGYHI